MKIFYILSQSWHTQMMFQKKFYIYCISQLHTLSLEYVGTKNIPLTTDASRFFQKHFKLLETLNLSDLTINGESAHNLVATLGHLNKLWCLKMNNCKLTSKLTIVQYCSQIKID